MTGKKIVRSGTDSLGFWFTLNQELVVGGLVIKCIISYISASGYWALIT